MSAEEFHPDPVVGSSLPCGINRSLLPIKAYYFVFMAAVGDLLPFISVYMLHIGLNDSETGIIYGVMPFVGFFVRPVIGALADKFHRHKLVLIIVTCITGLMYLLLVTVPQRPPPSFVSVSTSLACNSQDSFLEDCVSTEKDKCHVGLSHLYNSSFISGENSSALSCTLECKQRKDDKDKFQVCFTNDTTPFDSQNCDGVLKDESKFDIVITDLQSIFDAEVTQHTPDGCKIYDLKDVHYSSQPAWQILCDREVYLDCAVKCKSEICKHSTNSYDGPFFLFFFLFLMANVAFSPIFPILDAATYDVLGEKRHLWGKQRLWGTFGFAAFALTSSFVMYFWRKDKEEEVNYTYMFYIFGILCFLAAFLANFIPFSTEIKCGQFVKNVWKLLSFKEVSVFLLVIMYFGIVLGGLEAFLFRFLIELGSSTLVFGFMLLVNCLAEIPMLWIAGAIIKRIGLISCLYLALLCCGIRLIAYSLLQEPWYVLLVEPVHGVTFALMYAAASSYASIIAPPGMSATVQGLLGGVHFGFGKGIGSLVTGFMCESIGARWTWRIFSVLSIVILIIYFLLNKFIFSKNIRHPETMGSAGTGNQDETQPDHLLMPTPTDDSTMASPSPSTAEENHTNKI